MEDESKEAARIATASFRGESLDEVVSAIRKFEANVLNGAFEAGFRAGWEQAFKSIAEIAEKKSEKGPFKNIITPSIKFGSSTIVHRDGEGKKLRAYHIGGKKLSSKDVVLNYISSHPGLRGVDIAKALEDGEFSLPERTTRTALHRLRSSGSIVNIDGQWHPSGII